MAHVMAFLSKVNGKYENQSLKEAKAVVTHYHKYLSEHSLIKSVVEETLSLPAPKKAHANQSA